MAISISGLISCNGAAMHSQAAVNRCISYFKKLYLKLDWRLR